MRTFAAVAVSGALGLLLLKMLFPLLAMFFGFVALAFKILLFAVVAYFIYSLVRGKKRDRDVHETV
jgi:hypothetical protein